MATFRGFLGKTRKIKLNGRISLQILKKHYKSNILGQAFESRCKRFFVMQKNAKFLFLGLSHKENENMTFSFGIPSYVSHKTPEKVGASWILKKSFISWTSTVMWHGWCWSHELIYDLYASIQWPTFFLKKWVF